MNWLLKQIRTIYALKFKWEIGEKLYSMYEKTRIVPENFKEYIEAYEDYKCNYHN